jgi:hypothetical protein
MDRDGIVNPSTPRPKGRGLLGVDPERCLFIPPSKAGLGAAERVKVRFSLTFQKVDVICLLFFYLQV